VDFSGFEAAGLEEEYVDRTVREFDGDADSGGARTDDA